MTDEKTYSVNVWWKTEADFEVEAESEEEAREEAVERAKQGLGTASSPTDDEILSSDAIGLVDGNVIRPTQPDD